LHESVRGLCGTQTTLTLWVILPGERLRCLRSTLRIGSDGVGPERSGGLDKIVFETDSFTELATFTRNCWSIDSAKWWER
jgi:hypothetical protein